MEKKCTGEFKLNGKTYSCEVVNGVPLIDGKSVEEFALTLDPMTLLQFAEVGKQSIIDEMRETKPKSYQSMMDTFNQIKNN